MRKHKISIICSALLLLLDLARLSVQASAQTTLQALVEACPNGQKIDDFHGRHREAMALNDDNQYSIAKSLSREEYRCSLHLKDRFLKDFAILEYASDLSMSIRTNGDALSIEPIVIDSLNELAYTTKYQFIRDGALKQKKLAQDDLQAANAAVNQTPEPIPSFGSTEPSSNPEADATAAPSQETSVPNDVPRMP